MLAALFYYTMGIYIQWQAKPVILGFEKTFTFAYEIPFPAVSTMDALTVACRQMLLKNLNFEPRSQIFKIYSCCLANSKNSD